MERGKYRTIFASLAGGLWMLLVVGLSLAQEAKPAEEPAKAAAPAAARQHRRPNCHRISRRRVRIQRASLWPDPTGANVVSGRRRPAMARETFPRSCRFRISTIGWPTIFSRSTIVWALVAGFLVMFMQAGFMFVETGLCRAKNCCPYGGDEPDDLSAWAASRSGCTALRLVGATGGTVPCLRAGIASLGPGLSVLNEGWGLGAAVDAAGKATGAFTYGIIGTKGWFLDRRRG